MHGQWYMQWLLHQRVMSVHACPKMNACNDVGAARRLVARIKDQPSPFLGSAQVPVSGGGANDTRGLLNEQDAAGDPAAGRGGNVDQDWFMG
jgi:hypothetical protein